MRNVRDTQTGWLRYVTGRLPTDPTGSVTPTRMHSLPAGSLLPRRCDRRYSPRAPPPSDLRSLRRQMPTPRPSTLEWTSTDIAHHTRVLFTWFISPVTMLETQLVSLRGQLELIFFYTQDTPPFGALTLSIGWQEGHPACKLISTPASSFCTILVTNIHIYKQSENNNIAGKDSLQLSQVNPSCTQKTARFSQLRPTFHCILSIFPDHFQISTTGGSYASGENATF